MDRSSAQICRRATRAIAPQRAASKPPRMRSLLDNSGMPSTTASIVLDACEHDRADDAVGRQGRAGPRAVTGAAACAVGEVPAAHRFDPARGVCSLNPAPSSRSQSARFCWLTRHKSHGYSRKAMHRNRAWISLSQRLFEESLTRSGHARRRSHLRRSRARRPQLRGRQRRPQVRSLHPASKNSRTTRAKSKSRPATSFPWRSTSLENGYGDTILSRDKAKRLASWLSLEKALDNRRTRHRHRSPARSRAA